MLNKKAVLSQLNREQHSGLEKMVGEKPCQRSQCELLCVAKPLRTQSLKAWQLDAAVRVQTSYRCGTKENVSELLLLLKGSTSRKCSTLSRSRNSHSFERSRHHGSPLQPIFVRERLGASY